jgi:RNA polymerase sigma-70 factor (ECF subfamily)
MAACQASNPMVVSKKQVVRIDAGRPSEAACLEDVLRDNLDGLYRFALRLSRNAAEAQDLVQETATRALERQNTVVQNWRAWLFQTLYHAFISSRRHGQRWKEAEEGAWDEELEARDPLPTVIASEDVRRAIEALPEELRAVVWLSDAEELHLREIAQILGWPIGTVASRLWRARSELRKLLSAYGSPTEKRQ